MKKYFSLISIVLLASFGARSFAQEQVIDEVVAVVGANYILQSDVESQYFQYRAQGQIGDAANMKCQIFEDLLFQKLMLNQAELDSVQITDDQINQTMDARFRYYIQQFGSQEKLEQFYKKSLIEIKEDFRTSVKEQMMVEEVQGKIVKDVKVTPSEVRKMYSDLPFDSIPTIGTAYEVASIVKIPEIAPEELEATKERIKGLRERIMKGENFNALAVLYSEDPGSARRGGDIGFANRGQLYPEYEAAAFGLKKGEISDIIKSQAGYHIIQLIERRGEQIHTRHILLMPKVSNEEIRKATKLLDSIAGLIRNNEMTFEEAALKYSDDPSKINGGLLVNQNTGNTKFTSDQLDPKIYAAVDKMAVGDISKPIALQNEEGKQTLNIFQLKSRTEAHKASIKEDYNMIQAWALDKKKQESMDKWLSDKITKTYFRIGERYENCAFKHDWTIK